MTSVVERAMGDAFADLHPALQERFGLASGESRRFVGEGRMRSVRHNRLAWPALWWSGRRNVLFPETGSEVPATVRMRAFEDADGRETLAYVREFDMRERRRRSDGSTRRLDSYLQYDPSSDRVRARLGRRGDVESLLRFEAAPDGSLRVTSETQWLRRGGRALPVPGLLGTTADVRERYDEELDRFEVDAEFRNPVLGTVFAFEGAFDVAYERCEGAPAADAPVDVPTR